MSDHTRINCHLNIQTFQDEARQLVQQGVVSRHQPIYTLRSYIQPREWIGVEYELELHGFLVRDRIGDLMGREEWTND